MEASRPDAPSGHRARIVREREDDEETDEATDANVVWGDSLRVTRRVRRHRVGEEGVGERLGFGVNVWNVSIASRAAIRLSATAPAATAPAATAPAATSGALRSVGKETETRVSLPSPVSIMGKKKASQRKVDTSKDVFSRKKIALRADRRGRSVVIINHLPRRAVVAARRGIILTCKSKGVD